MNEELLLMLHTLLYHGGNKVLHGLPHLCLEDELVSHHVLGLKLEDIRSILDGFLDHRFYFFF